MISTKKFSHMAKKWERMADLGRKRLTLMAAKEDDECYTSVAPEGKCVMYSADGRRFKVPLAYLGTTIFVELLRMSQEEFGSDGRIMLLCDAAEMEYLMCLLRRNASEEVERAFLSSIVSHCHQGNGLAPPMELRQQVVVCSF